MGSLGFDVRANHGICRGSVKGMGQGTQIARLALEYAFEYLNADMVCAYTVSRNTRSQHVLEKTGFRFVDEKDGFKHNRYER